MGSKKLYTEALTADLLREHFRYDPEAGTFIRLRNSQRGRAGDVAGTLHKHGYLVIGVCGKKYKAHRLAWLYMTGEWPSDTVDHKDRHRANNRWDNLRLATMQEQTRNRSAWARKSGTKNVGVYWNKRASKWTSCIRSDGKLYPLGRFDSEEEALSAYLGAKARLHPIDTYGKPN